MQLVGVPGSKHAKAIGGCVYHATKLSAGTNEIYADDTIHRLWPKSKGGALSFLKKKLRQTDGYLISRDEV